MRYLVYTKCRSKGKTSADEPHFLAMCMQLLQELVPEESRQGKYCWDSSVEDERLKTETAATIKIEASSRFK